MEVTRALDEICFGGMVAVQVRLVLANNQEMKNWKQRNMHHAFDNFVVAEGE